MKIFLLFFFLPVILYGQTPCQKIISLAPSITEILVEIGLIDRISAVTTYDDFPAEINLKEKIGGFLDTNLEKIVSLRGDTVFLLKEQESLSEKLSSLKIKTVLLDHRSVDEILKSILTIGSACNRRIEAEKLHKRIVDYIKERQNEVDKFPTKKVLVVVSRNYDSETIKDLYVSGSDGFYTTLLDYAGAKNVFSDTSKSISGVSLEGLKTLDPDYIIELLPSDEIKNRSIEHLKKPWEKLTFLPAVREGRLLLIDDKWATIPGPRFTLLLDKIIGFIHG